MKIKMTDTKTGRALLATKEQAALLEKLGRAKRDKVKPSNSSDESQEKAIEPAMKANGPKGYNRRDMAKKTEAK